MFILADSLEEYFVFKWAVNKDLGLSLFDHHEDSVEVLQYGHFDSFFTFEEQNDKELQ